MSQEKVDRYKEEKANRQQIMKKQKLRTLFYKGIAGLVCLLVVWWIGYSVYQDKQEKAEAEKNAVAAEINLDAITEYMNSLGTEE